jgi:hypothetical protein
MSNTSVPVSPRSVIPEVQIDVATGLEWRTAAGVVCPLTVMGVGVRSGREVARAGTKPVQVAARPPTPRNKMLKARARRKGKGCRRSAGWCVRKSTWADGRLIALRRRNHVQTVAEPATGAVPGSPVPAASGVPESTMARLHLAGKGNHVVPMGRLPTDPVCLAGPWQRMRSHLPCGRVETAPLGPPPGPPRRTALPGADCSGCLGRREGPAWPGMCCTTFTSAPAAIANEAAVCRAHTFGR